MIPQLSMRTICVVALLSATCQTYSTVTKYRCIEQKNHRAFRELTRLEHLNLEIAKRSKREVLRAEEDLDWVQDELADLYDQKSDNKPATEPNLLSVIEHFEAQEEFVGAEINTHMQNFDESISRLQKIRHIKALACIARGLPIPLIKPLTFDSDLDALESPENNQRHNQQRLRRARPEEPDTTQQPPAQRQRLS